MKKKNILWIMIILLSLLIQIPNTYSIGIHETSTGEIECTAGNYTLPHNETPVMMGNRTIGTNTETNTIEDYFNNTYDIQEGIYNTPISVFSVSSDSDWNNYQDTSSYISINSGLKAYTIGSKYLAVTGPHICDPNYGCISSSTESTHWEAVADNDQSTYVYTNDADSDYYQMENFTEDYRSSISPSSVRVYATVYYNNPPTDPDPSSLKLGVCTHSNLYREANVEQGYSNWNVESHTWDDNPHTGSEWTWTEIDDLRAGILICRAKCCYVRVRVTYNEKWMYPTSYWNSTWYDYGSSKNFKEIQNNYNLNGDTIDIKIQSSNDGSSVNDETSWLSIQNYHNISTLTDGRYVRVKYRFTKNNGGTAPVVNSFNVNCWNTSNIDRPIYLKIPVSSDVKGITRVYNLTDGSDFIEEDSIAELDIGEYFFNPSDLYVYLCRNSSKNGTYLEYQVNCSYGITFNIEIPRLLQVGDYFMTQGTIENSTGIPVSGMTASTFLYYQNGSTALGPVKWNCTNGNFQTIFSTSTLQPGVYDVSIKFVDPDTGVTFKEGETLYLSTDTPDSGVYSDAVIYFNFYNTNIGLGLPRETLKIYVDGQRLYNSFYYTYTGDVINVTVKDYYNTTLYSDNHTVNNTRMFLDLGLTFHSWLFGNKNEEYYMISLLRENASRWWERGIVPNGEREFLVPSGNYTLRIYDGDYNMLYNTSDIVVNNSRVYVIEGSNLSEVISGLSIVRGQLLEVASELDTALMPDTVIWSRNPIAIFSVFDRLGQQLGNDVWKVCPALNVIAETRADTIGDSISSTALIPDNDTTENGTITILEDTLYISGNNSVSWVNITYTDNGTVMQNTTYIPNKINLYGENLTVNASCDIYLLRETVYSQMKTFYWNIWNSSINPGWASTPRPGFHRAGITVDNPLSVPIYNVYVYAGFSDKTTPDESTSRVQDVDNGVTLERGENFKTTDGIEFKIEGGLSAGEDREFTLSYYKDTAHTYYYEDAQIELRSYTEEKTISGYSGVFNYADFIWINSDDLAFRGSLRVKLNFDDVTAINSSSLVIMDLDNNQVVDDGDYIVGDEFILLSSNAMGGVQSGGSRSFGIYFQEKHYPGQNIEDYHLGTLLFSFNGIAISLFFILEMVCIFFMGLVGFYCFTNGFKDKYIVSIIVLLGVSVLIWFLQARGL